MGRDLTERAHAVRTAGTALDGIREVNHPSARVIVLDLGLPDLTAGQALKDDPRDHRDAGLVATARDEEAEIIRLLQTPEPDDYVVKAVLWRHLAARISALLRRAAPQGGAVVLSVAG